MTNDQVVDLAREFLGELMSCGVDEHVLQRMIRRAIEPIPYLNFDKWGQLAWDDKDLEIDPFDTPLRAFEMRELMKQNSDRCTGCFTVFDPTPEGYTRVAARVFRENVRTGVLCTSCYGEYTSSRSCKPAPAPVQPTNPHLED
jgi:hypothetical protein